MTAHYNILHQLIPYGDIPQDMDLDCQVFGIELDNLVGIINRLLQELDPLTSTNDPVYGLMRDYQRIYNLPASGTVAQQQAALLTKMGAKNGLSKAFFLSIAAQLGYNTNIPAVQVPAKSSPYPTPFDASSIELFQTVFQMLTGSCSITPAGSVDFTQPVPEGFVPGIYTAIMSGAADDSWGMSLDVLAGNNYATDGNTIIGYIVPPNYYGPWDFTSILPHSNGIYIATTTCVAVYCGKSVIAGTPYICVVGAPLPIAGAVYVPGAPLAPGECFQFTDIYLTAGGVVWAAAHISEGSSGDVYQLSGEGSSLEFVGTESIPYSYPSLLTLAIQDGQYPPFRAGFSSAGQTVYNNDPGGSFRTWTVTGTDLADTTNPQTLALQKVFQLLKPAGSDIVFASS